MLYYFSGIKGARNPEELSMLKEAGINKILIDWADLRKIDPGNLSNLEITLDSGAYRLWKTDEQVDVEAYLQFIFHCLFTLKLQFAHVVAPDVRDNTEQTIINWDKVKTIPGIPWIPVWGWGEPEDLLNQYLDEAPVVGIGGLVPLMRDGQWKKSPAAKRMLKELVELCDRHPGRFHIFGLNWLEAIEQLKDTAYSADSSKWLDGGRYGHVIFTHTRTGKLMGAPSKYIPDYRNFDRRQRCVFCAKTLDKFCL